MGRPLRRPDLRGAQNEAITDLRLRRLEPPRRELQRHDGFPLPDKPEAPWWQVRADGDNLSLLVQVSDINCKAQKASVDAAESGAEQKPFILCQGAVSYQPLEALPPAGGDKTAAANQRVFRFVPYFHYHALLMPPFFPLLTSNSGGSHLPVSVQSWNTRFL